MIAQDAYEALGLDAVWFIPTYLSPHKSTAHVSPEERVQMVEKMIQGDDRFECCEEEVASGRPQFSVDTVRNLKALHPESRFFWLIGSDQLGNLHRWKDVGDLASLSKIIVCRRPGYSLVIPETLRTIEIESVKIHELEISSSEVRDRIEGGLPVYMFLHPSVNEHIQKNQLYIKKQQ